MRSEYILQFIGAGATFKKIKEQCSFSDYLVDEMLRDLESRSIIVKSVEAGETWYRRKHSLLSPDAKIIEAILIFADGEKRSVKIAASSIARAESGLFSKYKGLKEIKWV